MSPKQKLLLSSLFFSGFAGDNKFLNTYFRWLGFKTGSGGGTAGSIVSAVAIAFLIAVKIHPLIYIFLSLAVYFLGPYLIVEAEREILRRNNNNPLKNHRGEDVYADFNFTVWDELAGMLVTCLPLITVHHLTDLTWSSVLLHLLLALIFFRIFDSTKPSFIGKIENHFKLKYYRYKDDDQHNKLVAVGIVLDDVAAGFAAVVICLLALILF